MTPDAPHSPVRRLLLVPVLCLLVLTGCRTYGGYGTEAITLDQIQTATQQFAESLEQARSDLNMLESAAANNPALDSLEQTYRKTVSLHEEKLQLHREVVARFESENGTYRDLSRNYGAILSDQRLVQQRYQSLLRRISRTVRGLDAQEEAMQESRYFVTPLFYPRTEQRIDTMTMNEALRGA